MEYKFYLNSEKAWSAMLTSAQGAEKSIYLEMYIFADNTRNYDFFGALDEKAKKGVKVKVIVDSFGSFGLQKKTLEEAEKSGVEVLFFNNWFHRTHRKILIVDDNIAYLGGVNISKIFRKWDDLQVRLQGEIVKSILKSFARVYKVCGGKDEEVLAWESNKMFFGKMKTKILEHWEKNVGFTLKKYYENRFENARNKIQIVTPFFVPSRWFVKALLFAVCRGVEVKIIIPRKSSHWFADRANYFYISSLYSSGVKFYISQKMNHAKAILIDDSEGMVSSQNIDILSLEYNAEIGVFFKQKEMVSELKTIMDGWEKHSALFTPLAYKPKWFDYLLAPLFKIFLRMF